MTKTIALTGGSGFVGRHLLDLLLTQGHNIRILSRAAGTLEHPQLTWVRGGLNDREALQSLLKGAAIVFHLAGAIKGFTRQDYFAANVTGTQTLLEASAAAHIGHFVHVSSLVARQPTLSHYAASKAAAEQLVQASGLEWNIVRPPAVYGPGDRETLAMFRAARWPVMPVSAPDAVLSLIHVTDLAASLVAAATLATSGHMIEVSDGTIIQQAALARMIGRAVGNRPLLVPTPRPIAAFAASLAELWARTRGSPAMLSRQKVNELYYPDWSVASSRIPDLTGWRATIPLAEGLARTATWYRAHGWL